MVLILQLINHVIDSHILQTNALKLFQHNISSQDLPAISEVA